MASAPAAAYQAISKRKRAERDSRIPNEWRLRSLPPASQYNVLDVPRTCGILSDSELRITEAEDATVLLDQLRSGRIKAVDVTTAFCKRAAIAQQLTNCLTEIFFDQGIARAKELDEYFATNGKPIGPLHGLPISIKDTFKVRGLDTSIGIASLCDNPATQNSVLVDVLLSLGAVLYCKTNIPQTLMALDSHNNVFGRTMNPANLRLTPGGSSGGEGALIALRGSILGVGTDIGGSIRVPAMCNGLYGVKPSANRVPYAGQESGALPGSDVFKIKPSAGPIAHSVRDCELFLQAVGEARAWELDPDVVPLQWTPSIPHQGPLIIGVIRTDGVTTPLPPIRRVMDETVDRLRASGGEVEVVELDMKDLLARCGSLVNKIFGVDGGNTMLDLIEATGEPLSPWLQSRQKRRPRPDQLKIQAWHGQRTALQTEFLKVWSETGGYWRSSGKVASPGQRPRRLDAIIAPVAPHPTPEIDRWNTATYTSSFVLLDLPAATLPVRNIGKADLQGELDSREPLSSWDRYNFKLWDEVDRNVYLDSSLCLHVVGPRLRDEKLLEAMAVLDRILRSDGDRRSSKL